MQLQLSGRGLKALAALATFAALSAGCAASPCVESRSILVVDRSCASTNNMGFCTNWVATTRPETICLKTAADLDEERAEADARQREAHRRAPQPKPQTVADDSSQRSANAARAGKERARCPPSAWGRSVPLPDSLALEGGAVGPYRFAVTTPSAVRDSLGCGGRSFTFADGVISALHYQQELSPGVRRIEFSFDKQARLVELRLEGLSVLVSGIDVMGAKLDDLEKKFGPASQSLRLFRYPQLGVDLFVPRGEERVVTVTAHPVRPRSAR